MKIQDQVRAALQNSECQVRILPITCVDEAFDEMRALFNSDSLDDKFAKSYKRYFETNLQTQFPEARSVIVTVTPEPMLFLHVTYRGKRHEFILPPGYAYGRNDARTKQHVQDVMEQAGFQCQRPGGIPMKLTAVRSGLCLYGRNNISYNPQFGSFIRLNAFVSDMPAPDDYTWGPVARMPECETCRVCVRACPTQCIDLDRNIIHGERCLTYLNEHGGDFPEWLNPSVHHTLVGCMRCQMACPQDKGHIHTEAVEDPFDEADIDAICAGGEYDDLPEKTRNALEALNLNDAWWGQALSRNMRALL